MRDQVCIILNEREPAKHAAVASLADLLKKSSITASRMEISEKIIELAALRCPQVLVLDYLLGDYSTGLDIFHEIKKIPEERRPVIFFLTDEPSVRVAVEAMLMGAKNYFQLDRTDSITKLSEEIVNILTAKKQPKALPGKTRRSLDSLIAQSPIFHSVVKQAQSFLQKKSKLIFILGPKGSGRSILAESIQDNAAGYSFYESLDLKYFDRGLNTLDQINDGAGIILENAEEDNGEVLAYLAKILKSSGTAQRGILTVTSSDKNTLLAWKKLLAFDVLEIPSLNERKEDIAPLAQLFIHTADSHSETKIKKPSPESISEICTMEWKGNIQQLKSVLIDSLIQNSSSKEDLISLVNTKREKWLEYNGTNSFQIIDGLTAARTVEMLNHNYRLAAVKLGCSVRELYDALNGAHQ